MEEVTPLTAPPKKKKKKEIQLLVSNTVLLKMSAIRIPAHPQ